MKPHFSSTLVGITLIAGAALISANAQAAPPGCDPFRDDRGWFVVHESPHPLPEGPFESADGQAYQLSDLAGKPLLVHFWGTWCPPCLKELPSINQLQGQMWNEGLLVLPLSRNSGGPDKVREMYDRLDIGFLPLFSDRQGVIAREADISSVPITLYVNREGQEIGRLYGSAEWTTDNMKNHVRACLLTGTSVQIPAF